MKAKHITAGLVIGLLLAVAGGCGKSDNTTPAPGEAPKPVKTEPAAPANVAIAPTAPATNLSAPAAPSQPPPSAPAPAPMTNAAPQNLATGIPVPSNGPTAAAQTTPGLASLSQDQMVRGLQEALGKGLQQAIAHLGHDGGFLTNLNVKIPMPEKLQKVETALRAMKQEKLADDFVATMNHAAEQAVPEAGGVFADALKQMTIEDAKSILAGPNDAATQYFQNATRTNLYARFYPIVQAATQKTGVTAAYKNLLAKANVGGLSQSLAGLGGTLGSALLDKDSEDIDAYVTNKSLDGLFKMVAEEELQVRQNPVARTSDLLQKVFGGLKN